MSTYAERLETYERADRAVKRAQAYLRSAERYMHARTPGTVVPPAYWDLLTQAIATATEIVECLPDDYFETTAAEGYLVPSFMIGPLQFNMSDDTLERAEKLLATIIRRRERERTLTRIRQLENTTGRTPEEAEMYRAKADELRRGLG